MVVSGQFHAHDALPPSERAPGTHWIENWVDTIAGLDTVEERKIFCSFQEWKPNIVAIPTEISWLFHNKLNKY
jgi:hypothetical protein